MPPERKLDNAGKRLGQWVVLQQPFAALWLPISLWGVAPVDGLALWESTQAIILGPIMRRGLDQSSAGQLFERKL